MVSQDQQTGPSSRKISLMEESFGEDDGKILYCTGFGVDETSFYIAGLC